MKLVGSQRGFIAALTAIAMLVCGAVLGMPGHFPTVDGVEYSPEQWFTLVGGLIAPLVLIIANFKALSNALTTRVNNPNDPYNPNDLKSLLFAKEFWVYVVAAAVGLGQMFGAKVLPAEEQIVIANGLLTLSNHLLGSWAERPSGMRQESFEAMFSSTNTSPVRMTKSSEN